ncbi:MAG: DUF2971 domain-containing protein [bacterium]|nr:DUF2971 domain-containing protein [bacterium]
MYPKIPPPAILYKYRTWENKFHSNILTERELFFSMPNKLNDPFDSLLPFRFEDKVLTKENSLKSIYFYKKLFNPRMSENELLQASLYDLDNTDWERRWKEYLPRHRELVNLNWGVLSMASENHNLLMWSHYANGHQGFCIGFDTRILCQVAECAIMDMNYTNEFLLLPPYELGKDETDQIVQLLITKSELWRYECEYRLLKFRTPMEPYRKLIVPAEAYKELIFGASISIETKKVMTDIATIKFPKMTIFQSEIDDNEFKLNFKKLN